MKLLDPSIDLAAEGFGYYEILWNFCRSHRAKPIIIDPGLYMSKKADVFWVSQKRSMPTAFKLFTGSLTFPFLASYHFRNMFKSYI